VTVGIAERSARLLAEIDDADLSMAAAALAAECDRRAVVFDELLARIVAGDDVVDEASDHRAECIHLAQRATTALLAGVGGRGMDLSHPAQRLAREADFFVIQAQTGDGRSAVLRSV